MTVGLKSAVAPKSWAFDPQKHALLVDSAMLVYLESVAESTHLEDARCLQGYQMDDTTFILEAAYDTPWLMRKRTSNGLVFMWKFCPKGTNGWWHAHPWESVKVWVAEQNLSPDVWCNLSPTDTARHKPFQFAVISIRSGLSCIFYQAPDGTYQKVRFNR